MDLLIALPTLITLSTIDRINNKNFELYGGSKKKKPKPKPKPAAKPAAKPPAAKPAAKPADKPAAKPAAKPAGDKSPAKPAGDKPPAAKPSGDKPPAKPAGDKPAPAGDKPAPAGDKPAPAKPTGASPSPNTGGPSNVSCRAKRRCAHLKPGGSGASGTPGTPGASGDGSGPTNVIYVHKKSWGSSFPSFSGMSGELSSETTNPVQYILLAVTHIVTSMILYNLMSFLF